MWDAVERVSAAPVGTRSTPSQTSSVVNCGVMFNSPQPGRISRLSSVPQYAYASRLETCRTCEAPMPRGCLIHSLSARLARQFFFVLKGELTLEVDHHNFVLHP